MLAIAAPRRAPFNCGDTSFLPLPRRGKRHSVKAAEKSVKMAENSGLQAGCACLA
jgi:hypothetical protein